MSEPKIAFFDVENAPNLGYYYDSYKENNIVACVRPWFMLSFAWKRPKEKKIVCRKLPDYPGYKQNKTNDERLVKDLWELFDSHDVLIGHNIRRFDVRKANSRFIAHGMKPPSPYVILDSLREWRKVAAQDSNRLDALSKFVGSRGKLPTQGWDTWEGAINGDPKSWAIMDRYNKHDVYEAEVIWDVIAPWVKNHPQLGPHGSCPVCSSASVQQRGFNVSKTRKTPRLHCQSCGHWFTGGGNGGGRSGV